MSTAEIRVAFSKDTAKVRQDFAETKFRVLKLLGLNPIHISYIFDIRETKLRQKIIHNSVSAHKKFDSSPRAARYNSTNTSMAAHMLRDVTPRIVR